MKKHFLVISQFALAAFLPIAAGAQTTATPAARAEALLKEMTLEEKIGQMVQADCEALKDKSDVQKYFWGRC